MDAATGACGATVEDVILHIADELLTRLNIVSAAASGEKARKTQRENG